MRRDEETRQDILDELRWSPQLDETDISVKGNEGVVNLNRARSRGSDPGRERSAEVDAAGIAVEADGGSYD